MSNDGVSNPARALSLSILDKDGVAAEHAGYADLGIAQRYGTPAQIPNANGLKSDCRRIFRSLDHDVPALACMQTKALKGRGE